MIKSEKELAQIYDTLSDEELLARWNTNSVVAQAKPVLLKTLQSRGIDPSRQVDSEQEEFQQQESSPQELDEVEDLGPAVTVARFTTGLEAHILRGRLEAEGIPAFIADEHLINTYSLISNALGGVRVQVPQLFVENALKILADIEQATRDDNASANKNQEAMCCPFCQSKAVKQAKGTWKIAFAVFYVFHLPLPFSNKKYYCESCGKTWKEKGK